ncbi:MAG: hypothetical protein K6B14_04930 [Lachnospiraceae bacterium]|nr:hypothetical protein [Lachnospiraceae bacterium]
MKRIVLTVVLLTMTMLVGGCGSAGKSADGLYASTHEVTGSPEKPYTGGCVSVPENIMKLIMQNVKSDCVVVIDTMDNLNFEF